MLAGEVGEADLGQIGVDGNSLGRFLLAMTRSMSFRSTGFLVSERTVGESVLPRPLGNDAGGVEFDLAGDLEVPALG